MTTDKPDATAESNAKVGPSMLSLDGARGIKTNLSFLPLMNKQNLNSH
jgi:hypothetical protein